MTPDELKALLDKATRGPWKWVRDHSGLGGPWRLAPGVMWPHNSEATPCGDEIDRANASLIAMAPDLAAEVIALREREARLVEAAKGLLFAHDHGNGLEGWHNTFERMRAALAGIEKDAA